MTEIPVLLLGRFMCRRAIQRSGTISIPVLLIVGCIKTYSDRRECFHGINPDSLRGFTFEEGYDLVIRTVYVNPTIVLKMYDRSWEVTMIFQRGRGDTAPYPLYTVLTRLSCPHAVFCFKKVTLLWAVSVGEGQAYVNESHGIGEGPNMLSAPYKPNFGQRRTAGFNSLIRRNFQQSELSSGFYRTFGKTMTEIDRYFYLGF